ncbi:MAG: hypothetical protein HC804_07615 [Anaerolineae bacterium]|nr:hypothetical protein [Anaerolineae bacterium]
MPSTNHCGPRQKSVHEETEAEEHTAVTDTPAIAPSRARVRIAGKRRPIGDTTWTAVDIFMEEPALRASQAHALSSLNREVAGVLVGPRPEKQPDGRYVVHIHDTIIAKHTVMHWSQCDLHTRKLALYERCVARTLSR